VRILLEVSKQFADAWISVYDSDGQFLLIEAALVIPSWITPENRCGCQGGEADNRSENRVWISNGIIHIIPLPRNPLEMLILPTGRLIIRHLISLLDTTLSVDVALSILRNQTVDTQADPELQMVMSNRLEENRHLLSLCDHWSYCMTSFLLTE
jgi:hypothetical protein